MKPTSSSCIRLVFFLPCAAQLILPVCLSVCGCFLDGQVFPAIWPSLPGPGLLGCPSGVEKQISSVHPSQQAPDEPPSTPTGFSRACQQQPVFLALKKSWDHLFLLSAVTADLFLS